MTANDKCIIASTVDTFEKYFINIEHCLPKRINFINRGIFIQ